METTEKENVSQQEVKTETAVPETAKAEGKKTKCVLFKKCWENKKTRNAIGIILLVVLVGSSFAYSYTKKRVTKQQEELKTKVEQFIKDNLVQPGTEIAIKDVTKEGALYKITVTVGSGEQAQDTPVYATADGKLFPGAPIDMNKPKDGADAGQTAAPAQKAEAEQKTDVPTVDLFVMSYCPYGLQMERGVLPAVEALGNKIKFNLKFVSYTLHGQKEVDENVLQYCVQKTQPAKLDNYLKCFWKDSTGASDTCMKTVGINKAQVDSCVAETNKKFSPTEKAFNIDKEENVKFGVQGSPTFVVNGTTITSGRDSASVMKAICSGFTKQPKECEAKLSATAPAAGFDDQAAAAGSAPAAGGAAAGACH